MNFKPSKVVIALISGFVFLACAAFVYFMPTSPFTPMAKEAETVAEDVLKEDLRD